MSDGIKSELKTKQIILMVLVFICAIISGLTGPLVYRAYQQPELLENTSSIVNDTDSKYYGLILERQKLITEKYELICDYTTELKISEGWFNKKKEELKGDLLKCEYNLNARRVEYANVMRSKLFTDSVIKTYAKRVIYSKEQRNKIEYELDVFPINLSISMNNSKFKLKQDTIRINNKLEKVESRIESLGFNPAHNIDNSVDTLTSGAKSY